MGVQRNRGGMHALAMAAATAILGFGATAAFAGDMKPLTVVKRGESTGRTLPYTA